MSSPDSHDDVQYLEFENVSIARKPAHSRWKLCCKNGLISSIEEQKTVGSDQDPKFIIPSLCHPHIHLDKCFLLSHPKYADLEIQKGTFSEAMKLTSRSILHNSVLRPFLIHITGEAKSRFEHGDLMERGRALVEESINFGVTHMRAFVEVDTGVGMKCLDAGLALKQEFQDRCHIQICVFAQDPIISYADKGRNMMKLLEEAASRSGVEALGSTPYVEENGNLGKQIMNMEFTIKTAKKYKLHLDFHIDYNLDPGKQSAVLDALHLLHTMGWPSDQTSSDFRTVAFGHCTRLTLFGASEWRDLCEKVRSLPIFFIGLPTSDLFMMGRPDKEAGGGQRVRGTLQVPQMIERYGLNAAIGANNVGNAFTPQGSCDPLSLASLGVGIYQGGTKQDADVLLVSYDASRIFITDVRGRRVYRVEQRQQ
jgi:hypothetical protein